MEHIPEEPIQSSPRLSSKYSKIPLDHRSRGEDGLRVHPRLNGYAHHQDIVSQDSNSKDEDKQGDEAANNYTSSSNDDDDRGGDDLNDHESSNNYDDEDNFASNNGVSAKSCTIQSTLYPKEDETFVGSN